MVDRGSRIPRSDNVTAELRAELAEHDLEFPGGEVAAFRRKIGEKGWFGLNWPREYGGLGLGAVHQHLLMSEFEYWGVPGPDLTVTSVAPMIMRHGTEQNKKRIPATDRQGRDRSAPSAIPSRTPEPTWPACVPAPSATATNG